MAFGHRKPVSEYRNSLQLRGTQQGVGHLCKADYIKLVAAKFWLLLVQCVDAKINYIRSVANGT